MINSDSKQCFKWENLILNRTSLLFIIFNYPQNKQQHGVVSLQLPVKYPQLPTTLIGLTVTLISRIGNPPQVRGGVLKMGEIFSGFSPTTKCVRCFKFP